MDKNLTTKLIELLETSVARVETIQSASLFFTEAKKKEWSDEVFFTKTLIEKLKNKTVTLTEVTTTVTP